MAEFEALERKVLARRGRRPEYFTVAWPYTSRSSCCRRWRDSGQHFLSRFWSRQLQKLAPGAIDGYFERANRCVLPKIQELQRCFRALNLPVIFCVFGSHALDGRDLPCWLKDFDKLGLQLLGRRPNPVVNGDSWAVEDTIARFRVNSSSRRLPAGRSAPQT